MKNRLHLILALIAIPTGAFGETQDYLKNGQQAVMNGDYDAAIAYLDKVITISSTAPSSLAYAFRGDAYEHKGNYDRAMADYNRAIQIDPGFAKAYGARGTVYKIEGKYDEAISDYDRAIALSAKELWMHNDRGTAYRAKGEYDKAILDFGQEISLNPKSPVPYRNRGRTYGLKGEYRQAIVDFGMAISLDPRDASSYRGLGDVYYMGANYGKAIVNYEHAILLEPEGPAQLNGLAWLLATCWKGEIRDGKKAVGYALQACELSKWKTGNYVDTLAAAYAEEGDFKSAVKFQKLSPTMAGISASDKAKQESRLKLYAEGQAYHVQVEVQP